MMITLFSSCRSFSGSLKSYVLILHIPVYFSFSFSELRGVTFGPSVKREVGVGQEKISRKRNLFSSNIYERGTKRYI